MALQCRRHAPSLFILALVLMTASCAGWGKFIETPRVSIASIRIQQMGLLEQAYQIDLRVMNPNEVPLAVKGLDCTLSVNGREFARGVSTAEATIPALGSGIVPIILYASLPDVLKALKNLSEGDQLKYTAVGRLRTGGGLFVPSTIPYEAKGAFSLKEPTEEN